MNARGVGDKAAERTFASDIRNIDTDIRSPIAGGGAWTARTARKGIEVIEVDVLARGAGTTAKNETGSDGRVGEGAAKGGCGVLIDIHLELIALGGDAVGVPLGAVERVFHP